MCHPEQQPVFYHLRDTRLLTHHRGFEIVKPRLAWIFIYTLSVDQSTHHLHRYAAFVYSICLRFVRYWKAAELQRYPSDSLRKDVVLWQVPRLRGSLF